MSKSYDFLEDAASAELNATQQIDANVMTNIDLQEDVDDAIAELSKITNVMKLSSTAAHASSTQVNYRE